MSMKNSIDTIGNGTRDLLAFSAMPQPTRAPLLIVKVLLLLLIDSNRATAGIVCAIALK
jgi:hypothetical protein